MIEIKNKKYRNLPEQVAYNDYRINKIIKAERGGDYVEKAEVKESGNLLELTQYNGDTKTTSKVQFRGGGGEPAAYLKSADVSTTNTIKLKNKDDSDTTFTVEVDDSTIIKGDDGKLATTLNAFEKDIIKHMINGVKNTTRLKDNYYLFESNEEFETYMFGSGDYLKGTLTIGGSDVPFEGEASDIEVEVVGGGSYTFPGVSMTKDPGSGAYLYLGYDEGENKFILAASDGDLSTILTGLNIVCDLKEHVLQKIQSKFIMIDNDTIKVNGTGYLYAASTGPEEYIKNASVSDNTLTLTNKDDSTVVYTPTIDLSAYRTSAAQDIIDATKLDASKSTIQTTAPTAAITDGGIHIVILDTAPATKYDGYIYLIG